MLLVVVRFPRQPGDNAAPPRWRRRGYSGSSARMKEDVKENQRSSERSCFRQKTEVQVSDLMGFTGLGSDKGSPPQCEGGSNLRRPPCVSSPVDRKQLLVSDVKTSKWLHLSNPYGSSLFVPSVDWLKHKTRRYEDFQTVSQHFRRHETRTTEI